MIRFVRDVMGKPFVRNVFTVATGTALAQIISLLATPVLTRLYGPEAYGLNALFGSVVSLAATAGSLGYPTAIVLPRKDSDARALCKLSLLLAGASAIFCFAVISEAGVRALALVNAESLSPVAFLVPIGLFGAVLASVLTNWLIRQKQFGLTARLTVISTVAPSVLKTAAGLLYPNALSLIVSNIIGTLTGALLVFRDWKKVSKAQLEITDEPRTSLCKLAIAHRDFATLRTPQNLINGFSQAAPLILLSSYFGAKAAGQYSVALAVLGLPATLIGGSVAAVFYPRINEAVAHGQDARALIIKATAGMAATGALPLAAVGLLGPQIFALAFGSTWLSAGRYAQLLSIWLFLQYINKPAVSAIPALRLQGTLLVYEVFSTGAKLLALWAGFVWFRSDLAAVALFSFAGSVFYVWLILWVIRKSTTRAAWIEH